MYFEDVDLSLRSASRAGASASSRPPSSITTTTFAKGAGEVAAARAQPLGDGRPLLSRPAADRGRARAARHRARAAGRRGGRRVAAAEAPRHGRGAAPAAGAAARAPRDPGDPHDPRGRVRALAHPRPRLGVPRARRAAGAVALGAPRVLAGRRCRPPADGRYGKRAWPIGTFRSPTSSCPRTTSPPSPTSTGPAGSAWARDGGARGAARARTPARATRSRSPTAPSASI